MVRIQSHELIDAIDCDSWQKIDNRSFIMEGDKNQYQDEQMVGIVEPFKLVASAQRV